jgi:phage shock protein PspC (stress-responsive transcriptional regulator)
MAGTLTRPPRGGGRMLAGVCAALAARFGTSVTVVRLLFIVFGLVGAGELAYLVLWVVIPKDERPALP